MEESKLRVELLSSFMKMIDLAASYDEALDLEYGSSYQEDEQITHARAVLMEALAKNWHK